MDAKGFALHYLIVIYFELKKESWAKKVIISLVKKRLLFMKIELGNETGESIAPLFHMEAEIGQGLSNCI